MPDLHFPAPILEDGVTQCEQSQLEISAFDFESVTQDIDAAENPFFFVSFLNQPELVSVSETCDQIIASDSLVTSKMPF